MKLEGMFGVVETTETKCIPPKESSVCICKSPDEAREYMRKSFRETLNDDIEDFGEKNVSFSFNEESRYARIEVSNVTHIVREFYLCFMIHDPR